MYRTRLKIHLMHDALGSVSDAAHALHHLEHARVARQPRERRVPLPRGAHFSQRARRTRGLALPSASRLHLEEDAESRRGCRHVGDRRLERVRRELQRVDDRARHDAADDDPALARVVRAQGVDVGGDVGGGFLGDGSLGGDAGER